MHPVCRSILNVSYICLPMIYRLLQNIRTAPTSAATLADTSSLQTSTPRITTCVGLFPLYNRKPAGEAFRNHNNGAMSPPLRPAIQLLLVPTVKSALSPRTFHQRFAIYTPHFLAPSPSRPFLVGQREPMNSKDSVQGCISALSLMCENDMQRSEFPQRR